MERDSLLNRGINAVKVGDFESGQELLKQVLSQDKNNVMAWLWYSKTHNSEEKRRQCIERALAIDPHNAAAKKMMALHNERHQNSFNEAPKRTSQRSETRQVATPNERATMGTKTLATNAKSGLGRMQYVASMNKFEQLLRFLLLIFVFGAAIFLLSVNNWDFIRYLNQNLAPVISGSGGGDFGGVLFFIVIQLILIIPGIFLAIGFVKAFFQSLEIYERGIVYNSLNKSDTWYWREFEKAKLTNQTVFIRYGFIPFIFDRFSLDLKSSKGTLKINKSFRTYRQIADLVMRRIQPYAEIKKNKWM